MMRLGMMKGERERDHHSDSILLIRITRLFGILTTGAVVGGDDVAADASAACD